MNEFDVRMLFGRAMRWYYDTRIRPSVTEYQIMVTEVVTCLRKAWYQRKYATLPSVHKIVILSIGDVFHKLLQEYLEQNGYQCELQATVGFEGYEWELVGHVDAINDDHILEFKTINALPKKPLEHHVLQVNTYLYMFNRPKGFIVYISKRTGDIAVFEVKPDKEKLDYVLERANLLYDHLKRNEPPPYEVGWLCDYCEFEGFCGDDR